MNAIRIVKLIDSETLHLPELKPLIGRQVEIVVYDAAPRTTPEEWAAYIADVGPDTQFDPDLIARYREFDRQHNTPPDL